MCASFDYPTGIVALSSCIATLCFILSILCAYMALRPTRTHAPTMGHAQRHPTARRIIRRKDAQHWLRARNRAARQRRAPQASMHRYR